MCHWFVPFYNFVVSTVWPHHHLFILFPIDRHVDSSEVGFELGIEGSREMVTDGQEEGRYMLPAEEKP